MDKIKFYLTIGLPGSGKSTWARKFVRDNSDTVVISRDSFREMVKAGGYYFDWSFEPIIKKMAKACLFEVLKTNKYDIIYDETNMSKKARNANIQRIFSKEIPRDKVEIYFVHVLEKDNNLDRRMTNDRGMTKDKWQEVLDKMKRNWEPISEEENFDYVIEVTDNFETLYTKKEYLKKVKK